MNILFLYNELKLLSLESKFLYRLFIMNACKFIRPH